jgi:hypothetical protein
MEGREVAAKSEGHGTGDGRMAPAIARRMVRVPVGIAA